MTVIDRLRALPARWWLIGGGVTALVLLVIVLSTAGGDENVATADDALGEATSIVTSSTSGDTSTSRHVTTSTRDEASDSSSVPSTLGATAPDATIDLDDVYELDIDENDPAVAGRPIPDEPEPEPEPEPGEPPPPTLPPPPWASSTRLTEAGHISTDVGCADDLSAAGLDWFFSSRVGPVIGWDYQHVYPLGDDRYLWLFQDAFLDHGGTVTTLGAARFIHNAALVQEGNCFTLLHRGTPKRPGPFEAGDGFADTRTKWFWPMGGELVDGELWVFWAEMIKDPYDPDPPDGLGWHPRRTFLAAYDAATLERTAFFLPPNAGVTPIYGYAVASDEHHTYLFGNTFEQNLLREGGFWSGAHSATAMWLARVPVGKVAVDPEYRTADGWSSDPADAVPILERFYAENPMQPRYLDGQWVAATAVNGYWGDHLAVDVADHPWGPWSTVQYSPLVPRNADPKMNTYHAHPLPWRDGFGSLLISVSNNARNMLRDAWPFPHRYRPTVIYSPFQPTPPPTTTTTSTTTTTTAPSTTTSTSTTTTTTLAPTTTTTTTTTTTLPPTTTTTTSSTTTTTTSTSSTTTTSTTLVEPPG